MTDPGPLQRYRCPYAGWAGEAVDVSPCGDTTSVNSISNFSACPAFTSITCGFE